ncbi:MAG: type II secretion system minor pseudopilin GspJ [Proteobacteria bacterium]|nr:type II secretion system minor pseudopilin GspJ [Pseudomonadota bacterium]
MKLASARGFTLIEVMVAMAIFGVMTVLAYMSLGQTLANAALLTARMDRLQAIQRTMRFIGNDLLTAAPRPVRSELGDSYLPAVQVTASNDYLLAITHGGWPNPAGLPRSTMQRSVYLLQEDKLLRVYNTVLDATYSNNAIATEILDGVVSLEFRLLQDNLETINQWPPLGAQGAYALQVRPRAVEIILTLEDEGEIRRLIEVAS